MAEIINIYDCDRQSLGTAEKKRAHRYGLWHDSVQIWLALEENGKQKIIYQRRAASKPLYPNALDTSIAGHVNAGEALLDAALREAKEELSILLNENDLKFLGSTQNASCLGPFSDNEFYHVYIARTPIPLQEMRFDDGEVSGVYAADLDAALALFSGEASSLLLTGYKSESGAITPDQITATLSSFTPQYSHYFLKGCICARQFLNGERYIAF